MSVFKAKIMRDAVREKFPTGDHLSDALTAVSNGMSAATLAGTGLPEAGTIIRFPQFTHVDYNGSPILDLIVWGHGSTAVAVAENEEAAFTWRIDDTTLGTLTGTVLVTPGPDGHTVISDLPESHRPALVQTDPYWTADDARRRLERIEKHGTSEMFTLIRMLIPFARDAVNSASMRVFREIYDTEATGAETRHIVDELGREQILDNLLWGPEGGDSSVLTREVRRCASTDHTSSKSVMLLIATRVWSSAETHVRQHIGDPHLGRVVRRLARDLHTLDPQVVHAAYREKNPAANVGISRVEAALTAGATLHADAVPYEEIAA